MYLELHDNITSNSLFAKIDVDFPYQAEELVRMTNDDYHKNVIKWILYDSVGITCVWERPFGSRELPTITQRAERFGGTWEKGPEETVIPLPAS